MHPLPNRRDVLLCGAGLAGLSPTLAQDDQTGGDPLGSMQYPGLREQTIGKAPARFNEQVSVKGPAFADDAMNVPLLVDARGLSAVGGGVARIKVAVDRNPVRQVLDFEPLLALPMLAFRIRMEQASPVRAFVQTRDGQWHVGGIWVQAAGGGCTVPGVTRADGSWSKTLGQVQARFFNNVLEGSRRLRVRVMHPMDTGLVAGIPAFYLEDLQLQDSAGQVWFKLALHEPVSENPLITFELPPQTLSGLRLVGRDNNGNRINTEVGV
ncbi:quinoprotein dehydrogenase-associated SoxYZ-like carrier [Hydrogenophaga sp.]|uniref:quinoprotein dehydrogenase-associated SoxYZ-like carrier n=1 Tax=Hydrogenophaga sp. TaxID=1904254 RepID=UPI003F6A556A